MMNEEPRSSSLVKLTLIRRVKSEAGKIKYGEDIGAVIGSGNKAPLPGGKGPSHLKPSRGVVHAPGQTLAGQPAGFKMGDLPAGTKVSAMRQGKVETFEKQKGGEWKHPSGLVVSDDHFTKFANHYTLSHVPTTARPIDKTKRVATRAKAGLYHQAAKFGETDMEGALTKKDMIEHFAHTYLLGGGHVGASDSALDRVVKLAQKKTHEDLIAGASDADLARAYKLAEKDAKSMTGVKQEAAKELCAKFKAEIAKRKSGK